MLWQIIKQHIYLYLLILTIVEWPITSFVSAGAAAQGVLRIEYVALIAFLGDLIGDIFLYSLWRFSHKINFLKRFSYFSQEKKFLSNILKKRPFFFMLIVKFTPYLSSPSLFFAGIRKMRFSLFFGYSLIISVLVKIVYLAIGYFWAITIHQLTSFLDGRQQIVWYSIWWIVLFLVSKHIYTFIWNKLKNQNIKKK